MIILISSCRFTIRDKIIPHAVHGLLVRLWKDMSLTWSSVVWLKKRDRMLTRDGMISWGFDISPMFLLCGIEIDPASHIFFDCQYTQCVWRASGISNNVINSPTAIFEEKIKACLLICYAPRFGHFQDLPLWILWRLWKAHNNLIFQRKQIEWKTTLQYAQPDAQEWK